MVTTELRLPELAAIAGTRGLLGVGVGLLLADRMSRGQRHGIGWALVAVGIVTTVPLARMVLGRRRRVPA